MFDRDNVGNLTRRFGGVEFVPSSITVRSYGERTSHLSAPVDNQGKYNDFVPLVYGTGWYEPLVVFARNDGNLTRMEALLGAGEVSAVLKVIVSDIEIPVGSAGLNMTTTGWYNVVTTGDRTGGFNLDFTDSSGKPLGDPYGSLAVLSVVVPNRISNGRALPRIRVLLQGMKLARYDENGEYVDDVFTNNPAWVLLDVLRRSGWSADEIELRSVWSAAQHCDVLVPTVDLHGNSTLVPKYQCNLILMNRRSAADVVRGIRNGSGLYLVFDSNGKLQVRVEDTIANQQSTKPNGSNSTSLLNAGWPAYEFGDNSFSGILRKDNGEATLRVYSRTTADMANRMTVEFQDEFNEYQQDSLSLVDIDDSISSGQDIATTLAALGLPNCDQATRVTALQLKKSVRGNTYVEFGTSVRAASLRPGDIITLTYAKEGFDRQAFRITRISPNTNFRTAVITAQIHDDAWYSTIGTIGAGTGRQPNFEIGPPRPLIGSSLNSDGTSEFAISQKLTEASDGTISCRLTVAFCPPAKPADSQTGPPLVGLNPQIDTTGGGLGGGQTLYYAISGVDSYGSESALSFLIKATIPFGTDTNRVTLRTLGFSSATNGFHVYRGQSPTQLARIADNQAVSTSFVDSGVAAEPIAPPDFNYDHANFYWRLELQAEKDVGIHSYTTIGNSTLNMLMNDYVGARVRISKGRGAGQERVITSNDSTTLNLATKWDIEPDDTSGFLIADSIWQFGASGSTTPISFEVPNREGVTVHVSGRSANVRDEESALELSPITRWRIAGSAGTSGDFDVPSVPTFGLSTAGLGMVEVAAIGFNDLSNTRSVTAGTLTLLYWDELKGPSSTVLTNTLGDTNDSITLAPAAVAGPGDLVQVESEIMAIQVANGGGSFQVQRGTHGTTAAGHAAQSAVYLLERKIFVMSFGRDFFGSPYSGSYSHPVFLPSARIAAAELFVTNARGNSDVYREAFTATTDLGLRTLSGGQLTMQVEGLLAIQANAVPALIMESSHAVRDVFAVVADPSTGTAIQLQVTQEGEEYCALTIPVGSTISNIVGGFPLGPLRAGARIGLNIVAVSQTSDTLPGRDLTVTIRL